MTKVKISLSFVFRNLLSSLLIIFVVMIGIGSQIFIIVLSDSLSDMIVDQTTSYQEDIRLSSVDLIDDYNYLEALDSYDDVKYKTMVTNSKGMIIKLTPEEIQNIMDKYIQGENLTDLVDEIEAEPAEFILRFISSHENYLMFGINEETLKRGRLLKPTDKNKILLDDNFAQKNNISINDNVAYGGYTKDGQVGPILLQVVGTYETNVFNNLTNMAYITSNHIENEDVTPDYIAIQAASNKRINNIIGQLKRDANFKSFQISTNDDLSPYIGVLKKAQIVVTIIIQIFISLAIFLLLTSIIGFFINKKINQIGILKAIGYKQKDVEHIFLLQSFYLGTIGAILGYVAAYIGLNIFQEILTYPDGRKRLNITFKLIHGFYSFILVFLVVYIASYFSIKKTRKLEVIELIKH